MPSMAWRECCWRRRPNWPYGPGISHVSSRWLCRHRTANRPAAFFTKMDATMTSELPANLDLKRRHSDIRAVARRALSTNDTLDLAILGITGLYAMSEERLLQLLQHIGCPLFRPTPDLVLARMQTLMRQDMLESRRDGSGQSVLSPTLNGAAHLRLLLATPGPAES